MSKDSPAAQAASRNPRSFAGRAIRRSLNDPVQLGASNVSTRTALRGLAGRIVALTMTALLTLLLPVACHDDELPCPMDNVPAVVPASWPAATASFQPDSELLAAHPLVFAHVSRWVTHVSGPLSERPDVGHRGSYGTGNGYVFGFVGLGDPLNTLHSMTGPTYERGQRFFGDYAVSVGFDGDTRPRPFDEEWATRSLSAPVLMSRATVGKLQLDTVDFAPTSDNHEIRSCFVRLLVVTNQGTSTAKGVHLVVSAHQKQVNSPGIGLLAESTKDRSLLTGFDSEAAIVKDRSLRLSLDELPPGGRAEHVLLHCTDPVATPRKALPHVDVHELLDATATAYAKWSAPLLSVTTPDPMVNDFVDGMKMTLKVQTAASGASCPMSEYTRTWARDNIGPTLALLDLGAFEDVRDMMDYIYGAVLLGGDLSNSYAADLDLSHLPPAPSWDSMPGLSGRVGAETPSYMVWMYGDYYARTADLSRAKARYGFVKRCLLGQQFNADDLLPFTEDETFRPAMNAAFGLSASYSHKDKSWSANSSLLWLGAEKRFVRLARDLGHAKDVAIASERAKHVEQSTVEHYLLPDGCLSPFVDRTSGQPWPAPFEDVSLKMTWAGWLDGQDPMARGSLACLQQRVQQAPGVYVSPKDPDGKSAYLLLGIDGIYTGMLPAYALSALTSSGHAHASAAFNWLGASLDPSGNCLEDVVLDDHSGLSFVYDQDGLVGDYTAKFRPWEGGIALDALLQYLLGLSADAPTHLLSLRPHLPTNWPGMSFERVRVANDWFDVSVGREGESVRARVSSHAKTDYHVSFTWQQGGYKHMAPKINGEPVGDGDLTSEQWAGMSTRTLKVPVLLPAGGEIVFQ